MTTTELRELDAWIAEHVMDRKPEIVFDLKDRRTNLSTLQFPNKAEADLFLERYIAGKGEGAQFRYVSERRIYEPYSTSPADAMEVLKKCAEERAKEYDTYRPSASLVIYAPCVDSKQWIVASDEEQSIAAEAETIELTICLFAKKLFA